MSSAALVKFDEGALAKPLNSVEEFGRFCVEARDRAFILAPITKMDYMPEIFQISRRMVMIDPSVPGDNQSGPECYHSSLFHKEGEVSLGRTGLLKILGAAGASPVETVRTDDQTDPHRCAFRVVCAMQDYDGAWRQMPGTAELDLRDGSEDAKKMKPGQLTNARRKIVRLTESLAMNAAIRALLGLPHKFKVAELKTKPFIIPKLILRDSHPAVQEQLIANSMGITRSLYGPQPGDHVRTIKDVTPTDAPPPEQPAPRATAAHAPVSNARNGAPAEEPDDSPSDDFDLPDFTPATPAATCGCPCSCQKELTAEVAQMTTERCGAPRCKDCFPGKAFDAKRHTGLRSLGIPKHPNLTAEDIAKANAKRA